MNLASRSSKRLRTLTILCLTPKKCHHLQATSIVETKVISNSTLTTSAKERKSMLAEFYTRKGLHTCDVLIKLE